MKFFLLFLTVLFSLNGSSQENGQIKVLSLEKETIKDDNVNYINVIYANQKASYIKIFSIKTTQFNGWKEDHNYFDLNFEGDRFILHQDYPWLNLPNIQEVQAKYLNANLNANIKYLNKASLYRDSSVYYFSDNIDFYGKIPPWGFPAKYLGDINNLQQQIATQVSSLGANALIDSVCVFELIISRSGELKSINLIGGTESDLSNIVKAIFLLKENRYFDNSKKVKWSPAIIYSSGRPIETKLKVFVKVNKDKSVQILLPKTMRNFTGS
ncbi:hypothetical protein BWD42_09205 [Sphingobacterium sp. CZ-UAM]|jgi:hypothetical protein|uniref:hypothetical protein n=1 Tax=Sphingobacterium sp. CZ-UAM TaxID=1933868 RepID=UPI0009874C15|nr:hypothetical protein [Sphingobacterium sp. CZ-UAM]OOG20039.1 hypothetical protein BWD42_09205 [Sphingobacterium sp. CZ-UAM]